MLKKRRNSPQIWGIGDPNNNLGMWTNISTTPSASHPCHPEFLTIPIGNPYGFAFCVRKPQKEFQKYNPLEYIDMNDYNGIQKYQADMYRPWRDTQIQMYNPDYYYQRFPPYLAEAIDADLLARPMSYNGIGVNPIQTPGYPGSPDLSINQEIPNRTGNKYPQPEGNFYEYGFSATPDPPYKYDILTYEQKYPVWKDVKLKHAGNTQAKLDQIDRTFTSTRY